MLLSAADIEAIERATVAAVAPREVLEWPGWLAAFDDGTVNRARSAVPLSHDVPHAAAVPGLAQLYRERGVMPNFRIPQIASMAALEQELVRVHLQPLQPTQVLVAAAGQVANAVDAPDAPDASRVQIAARPDDAWAALFLGEGFDPVDGASRAATLRRASGSLFGAVREGGEVVAAGVLAFGHGWASIHGMRTAAAHRGRGLATRVLAAFAREALARNHGRLLLQVEVGNLTATRVYSRCGFEHAWTYAYWRER